MTFGERIVAIRKEKGLTQKALAEQLGISPTRLNYWEKDKRFPPIPMLNRISEILGVDGDYLLGRSESVPEQKEIPSTPDESEVEEIENWLTNLLVERGYIRRGEDLSDRDADFLIHWIGLLDAWFEKE
mgnify:CR=1 FL=1